MGKTCPGCNAPVKEGGFDVLTVGKKTWHKTCYDRCVANPREPMSYCPWCNKNFGDLDAGTTIVSKRGRRWHRGCWDIRLENRVRAEEVKQAKLGICQGCKRRAPSDDEEREHQKWQLSRGGFCWCYPCWLSSLASGRFQVGTVSQQPKHSKPPPPFKFYPAQPKSQKRPASPQPHRPAQPPPCKSRRDLLYLQKPMFPPPPVVPTPPPAPVHQKDPPGVTSKWASPVAFSWLRT